MEQNGDLYACDHFAEPAYRLGNILEVPLPRLIVSERQRRFGRDKQGTLPAQCRACDVGFACHGGCPKDRFLCTPAGESGLNYLCAGLRAFFRHVDRPMRFMAGRLRRGGSADEIMGWYVRVTIRPSRRSDRPDQARRKADREYHIPVGCRYA